MLATDEAFDERLTLPVLWDTETRQIVSNESGEILRMLNGAFDAYAEHDRRPLPTRPATGDRRPQRAHLPEPEQRRLRGGVQPEPGRIRSGVRNVFAVLDELEERLAASRYLVGDTPTEADWRLFPTLVRFDTVYYLHFNCNVRRSSTTRISGATRATCTSYRGSPRRSTWPRSSGTTTRRTT